MIRGVCAAKRAPSWQDIHVVYPPTAICRAFRMHGAHILPKPAHFGCVAAIYCHEGVPFPSEAFFGIHRGKILPSSDTRERRTSTYRQQSHPSATQGAACSFPPYPARAHPRDAAVPSCGGGRRRDERAGALARAAYWGGRGRDIDARRLPGAREGHRRAPFAGCGDALTCSLLGARGPSAAGSQPAEAWSRLGRGRAAATRTRIRTAAPSAHQTRRSCCRYARRDGAVSFARTVR